MQWDLVVDGLAFPEGLGWSASDNTLVVSAVAAGAIYRISFDTPRPSAALLADTGGCANGCTLADDGSVLVTQNGNAGGWVQERLNTRFPGRFARTPDMTPGVQRVMADGSVGYLAANGFNAPNDVTVTHDGNIVLTDPGIPNHDPAYAGGRVLAIRPDGAIDVIADSLFYPNGILALRGGSVVVTERQGVLRIDRSGRRTWIVENIGGRVDGLAADSDNRLFVAGQAGLQVIAADGVLLEFLAIPGANTTNCCFGGPDLRWLFVTDAAAGTVLVCRDIDATGEPVTLWRAPTPH